MKMTLTCNTCGKELIQIEKETISQDDQDLYQECTSCSVCDPQDIKIEVIN